MSVLQEQFGQIDIYLFDQLLRIRISPGMRILDAGCGSGRNLVYLLRAGYEVFGADTDSASIAEVRRLAARLAPTLPADNFRVESLEALTFPSRFADIVICSAVLHFAPDDARFNAMLEGCWRVLKPGGLFFCRLRRQSVWPVGGNTWADDGTDCRTDPSDIWWMSRCCCP